MIHEGSKFKPQLLYHWGGRDDNIQKIGKCKIPGIPGKSKWTSQDTINRSLNSGSDFISQHNVIWDNNKLHLNYGSEFDGRSILSETSCNSNAERCRSGMVILGGSRDTHNKKNCLRKKYVRASTTYDDLDFPNMFTYSIENDHVYRMNYGDKLHKLRKEARLKHQSGAETTDNINIFIKKDTLNRLWRFHLPLSHYFTIEDDI